MSDTSAHPAGRPGGLTPEFWLVVIMLGVLTVLVVTILAWPITVPAEQPAGKEVTLRDVFEYRAGLLSVIITAFGAWVGAGAAYFFGRENLRVAANSLLAMREPTPRERLRRTSVRDLSPVPITWTVKPADPVAAVKQKLDAEPAWWFVPVVKDDGALLAVVREEGVLRFLLDPAGQPAAPAGGGAAQPKTVGDLLAFLDRPGLERFKQIHVTVTPDTTVGAANELMEGRGVFLAVVETDGKPTHVFTTADVRKLLLREAGPAAA